MGSPGSQESITAGGGGGCRGRAGASRALVNVMMAAVSAAANRVVMGNLVDEIPRRYAEAGASECAGSHTCADFCVRLESLWALARGARITCAPANPTRVP